MKQINDDEDCLHCTIARLVQHESRPGEYILGALAQVVGDVIASCDDEDVRAEVTANFIADVVRRTEEAVDAFASGEGIRPS